MSYLLGSIRTIKNHLRPSYFARWSSCWQCGDKSKTLISNLFCPNCKSLQEPQNKNYFNVIGISESYDIDETNLAKKYKELQKLLHPDKFANRDKKEQEISESFSSLVNEAYNTLLQPLSRGIYMLNLKGQELPEQTDGDQAFLMEIMQINEEVEEATSDEDILALNKKNKLKIDQLTKLLSNSFRNGNLKEVMSLLSKLKYYTSIDNQIQSSIRNKGIIR